MKIVRNGVFETNSSSCHSLILNGKMDGHKSSIYGEVLHIYPESYGWETVTYERVLDKLTYIVSSMVSSDNMNSLYDLLAKIIEENSNIKEIVIVGDSGKYSFDAVKWRKADEFHRKDLFWSELENISECEDDICVDHQSAGIYSNLTIDEIYYLITSDDSVIITSNDNGGSSSIWVPTKIIEKIEGRIGKEKLKELADIYEHSSWKGDNIRQNILFDNYAYDSETGEYKGSPYDLGSLVKY